MRASQHTRSVLRKVTDIHYCQDPADDYATCHARPGHSDSEIGTDFKRSQYDFTRPREKDPFNKAFGIMEECAGEDGGVVPMEVARNKNGECVRADCTAVSEVHAL